MKKFLFLLICTIMSASIFCGCDDGDSVPMEDLPYGSTMRQLNDASVTICFDGRYFTDEEMKMVSDYFYAVQTKDVELFKKTLNPDFVSYLEINSNQNLEDFLTNISMEDAAALGENFQYSYIEAVSCGDKSDDMQIEEIIDLMNTIYEENGKDESFRDTIKDEKFATLNITANSDGNSYNHDGVVLYIFTCNDGIYIFD